MLTENIQSTKLLVNGASGFLHSLTLSDTAPEHDRETIRSRGFKVVILDEPPFSVNFQLSLPDGDAGEGIESLVDDAVVVPVLQSKHAQEHDTTSMYATMSCVPKTLRYRGHGLTLAFAVTDYKLQGKTMEELVLSIAPRPFLPRLDITGFYVDVSRVRRRSRLRVLHLPSKEKGGLTHLFKLRHAPSLAVWDSGYDAQGDWQAAKARASTRGEAQKHRPVRKQPRRKT